MILPCARCGKQTPYFTETYDPDERRSMTVPLCEEHQRELVAMMMSYIAEGKPRHDCSGCPECMVLMSIHPARAVPDPNSETCTGCQHYWDYRQEGKA